MTDTTKNIIREDLIVTRIIDAPLELVWKAWTEPERVMKWWGPKHYTSPSCTIDLREGGKFIFCMRAPEDQGGQEHYTSGIYRKIIPMQYLEFTQSLADKDGNPIDPAQVGMPSDFPAEIRTSIVFKAKGDMTEVIITEYDWPVSQMYVYSLAGLHQTIDKLAAAFSRP
jgi:uncharacterized protein YndB with AHSA1/START domain